ncbi:protein kinase C SCDLUD_000123 [Saccharomycodes ludwigii]|uniref:protein kinase C n=1 Tax=Saccharomycodes ludwigii TaxID=36035 RepID=UPI001E84828B|nr:hypothetical protein SCDLUD_000123 [Saccharomycodes ludwigii]KAH3902544.1 hypothetical protein SCDLUD_000123 [Saccharomycodes ludwigii]
MDQIQEEIAKKIDREKKIIQGASTLKKRTSNVVVIQKCNNNIREAQQNIDYLQETLNKLTIENSKRKNKNSKDVTGSNNNGSNNHNNELAKTNENENQTNHLNTVSPEETRYSRLDLVKYNCPSLAQRIQVMLQQLEFKLKVEQQYYQANEKLTKLYQIDGDQRTSSAAEGGVKESKSRIQMLTRSLKKYQAINVDPVQFREALEVEEQPDPKFRRKQLTGVLTLSISAIRDVDHISSPLFSRKPETIITIKIDDVERARTKPSRTDRWTDEFNIHIDKGNEVEITIYDRVNDQVTPVAVMWLLLSDIAEEIRKKKVGQNGLSGWANAQTVIGSQEKSTHSSSAANTTKDLTPYSHKMSAPSSSNTASNNRNHSATPTGTSNSVPVTTNAWFILEPTGQILLTFGFTKTHGINKRKFIGGLDRHGAIIKREEGEVYEQHGHHFVQKSFYNIMCCAYCGDFLRYTGFQCQDCKFLCHKKCYRLVVTKCIAKSSTDIDPDEAKLNHRIPHRFEPASNRGTKWCCHCGYILPWGRKNVRKCTECGIMCHAQCAHLVPDFCGMSMEMANQILTTIKNTKVYSDRKTIITPSGHVSPVKIKKKPHHKKHHNKKDRHSNPSLEKENSSALSTEITKVIPAVKPVASTNELSPEPVHKTQQQQQQQQQQSIPAVSLDDINNNEGNKVEIIDLEDEYKERDNNRSSISQVVQDKVMDRLNAFIDNNDVYESFAQNAGANHNTLTTEVVESEPEEEYNERSVIHKRLQSVYEQKDSSDKEISPQESVKMDVNLTYDKRSSDTIATKNTVTTDSAKLNEGDLVDQSYISIQESSIDDSRSQSNPFREMNHNDHHTKRTSQTTEFSRQSALLEVVGQQKVSTETSPIKKHKKKTKRRKVSLDDFVLLQVLGKGNFGKVLLAQSKNNNCLCAIKVLKKEHIIKNHDIESARAEKKVFLLATEAKHPFLTNLYCSFQTENRIYFAMEFIGGGDLMWHVQNQRLSVRRAKFYAAEVLLALKYFHEKGVIYRDLKLENILLTPEGHIKIADYGLCKDEMWYGCKTSTFCGTPEFMAPEILKEQEYTKAVDWWAFGVLLYQMLLCQSPFSGDDEDEVFNAILTDEPLYPIDMAGDIVQIFQGLLTKDPEKRLGAGPKDALEVMEEPFFRNINFDDILNLRVKPPYIPEIKGADDTQYFEKEFTSAPPTLTPLPSVLSSKMQEEFRGFSFMPEDLAL